MKAVDIDGWIVSFDEEAHAYSDAEGIIPGVSGILKAMGVTKDFYKGTEARDRGTRIHQSTELMDTLGLGPLDFDEELHPYLTAWNRYRQESGAKILDVERIVAHRTHRYAGTMDRRLELSGFPWVSDIKSGSKADWHRLQLAAYSTAWTNMTGEQSHGGVAVYLKGNGKYTTWPLSGAEWKRALLDWVSLVQDYKEQKR